MVEGKGGERLAMVGNSVGHQKGIGWAQKLMMHGDEGEFSQIRE